jgi:hypothetical protein
MVEGESQKQVQALVDQLSDKVIEVVNSLA